MTGALHLNVTWIPCWLPSDPAGHVVPAGNVVRFWLCPLGPLTKIRNVCPAFADPKQNNASMKFALITANRCDGTVAPVAASIANTVVTFNVPFGRMKHAPEIVIS